MANRKQTPDVLGEILGSEPVAAEPAPETQPARRQPRSRQTQPRQARARNTSSRSQKKPAQFEYKEIVFRDYGGYRPRFVNGDEQVGWKKAPLIHEYLNQLGEEGWELAGIVNRDRGFVAAYLKRLKL